MRQTSIILTILLLGCSTKQVPENKSVSSSNAQASISEQSTYILTNTNKCSQSNLSKQFDVSIDFKRFHDSIEYQDSCIVSVSLNDKQSGSIMDSFTISSSYYFSDMFLSCDSMTSFSTKLNADREFGDNYYGDLVVVDLNFDGLDDIAVVNNAGGNSGPLYSFYTQADGKKFVLDRFLTDSLMFFPSEINRKNKTLTISFHVGACGLSEDIYMFDNAKKSWIEKSSKVINVCDE